MQSRCSCQGSAPSVPWPSAQPRDQGLQLGSKESPPRSALELPWALPGFLLGLWVESASAGMNGEVTYLPGWDHLLECLLDLPETQG